MTVTTASHTEDATAKELIRALRDTETRSKRALLDEAADRIERMQWIPVEERLPAADGVYVVHCDDSFEPMDERIWGDSVVVVADWCFGCWTFENNGVDYDLDGIVTHWMPLPEGPEVK